MAGVILVIFGLARLGAAIKFIPRPVITGFTSGIAVIIFSSEIKDFLGLRMGAVRRPTSSAKWAGVLAGTPAASTGGASWRGRALAIIVLWPRVSQRVPGPFVALIVTTAARARFSHLPVETIGSRFGGIAASLPHAVLPHVSFATVTALVGPAFTIALLGGDRVAALGRRGRRHDRRPAPLEHGAHRAGRSANIVSPLFGGIPATGAIARTATNVKNGGRTPVAGIVHALTLLRHHAVLRPLGRAHSDGDPGRDPAGRRLPHERVAHVPRRAPGPEERRRGAARDLPAHGAGRPHRRDRGRDGARGVPLHAADGRSRPTSAR